MHKKHFQTLVFILELLLVSVVPRVGNAMNIYDELADRGVNVLRPDEYSREWERRRNIIWTGEAMSRVYRGDPQAVEDWRAKNRQDRAASDARVEKQVEEWRREKIERNQIESNQPNRFFFSNKYVYGSSERDDLINEYDDLINEYRYNDIREGLYNDMRDNLNFAIVDTPPRKNTASRNAHTIKPSPAPYRSAHYHEYPLEKGMESWIELSPHMMDINSTGVNPQLCWGDY